MKNKLNREELLKKFVNNQCTPKEREQVFAYLKTDEADHELHATIEKEIVISVTTDENTPLKRQLSDDMYQNIVQIVNSKKSPSNSPKITPGVIISFFRVYWKIAATCTGILIIAGISYHVYLNRQTITHTTAYGQTSTILLPDQTTAILNGNSSIRYNANWERDSPRKVWISGEVFFSVTHTASHQKFIVHTSDQVNVEVMGTEFNVYNRKNKTRVVLNSGKVQLNIQDKKKNNQVTMAPGELVEFTSDPKQYVKKDVNAERYSAWMNKKLILENTSFREIANVLEETYGIFVIVPDKSLYTEKFTGIVPCENAAMLINALSLSFNLKVYKSGNQIKFQAN